jgi:hypothetical protein
VGARDRPLIVLFEQDNPQERVMASRLGERWNWEAGGGRRAGLPSTHLGSDRRRLGSVVGDPSEGMARQFAWSFPAADRVPRLDGCIL